MIRLRHKLFLQALILIDQFILITVFLGLAAIIEERGHFEFVLEMLDKSYQAREGLAIALTLAGWFFVFTRFVRYGGHRFTSFRTQVFDVVKATTFTSLVLFIGGGVFDVSIVTAEVLTAFWGVATLVLILARLILRGALTLVRLSGRNCRHLVIVGGGPRAAEIATRIEEKPELGYEIVGFLLGENDSESEIAAKWKDLGRVQDLREILERGLVDEVMICLSLADDFSEIYEAIEMCHDLGIVVRLIPDLPVSILSHSQVEEFEEAHVVTFFRENLVGQLFMKRLMDFVVSLIALVLLSPLVLLVAFLVKVTSKGPVFFAQERIGMNKRRFKMLKFRSMVVDAEDRKKDLEEQNEMDGPVFKIKNDPRITKIGAIIRKLSIDELPQLINVLKGEMSLVGPRPPLWSEVDKYDWSDRRRLSIKPGITCIWQVSGRNNLTFEEWMELDREYIDNWSIWMDVKILLKTIPVVLFGYGAS